MVEVSMAGPVAWDSEMEGGQPLVPPLAIVGERLGGGGSVDLSCRYFLGEGGGGC